MNVVDVVIFEPSASHHRAFFSQHAPHYYYFHLT
jgi:hypothetical protein